LVTFEGYSVHHPFSRGPKGVRFHRDAAQHTLTLSSTCFPTEAIEIRLGFTRLRVQKLQAPFKISQALPSTISFLFSRHGLNASFSFLILSFQRLLQILDPYFTYPTILHHLGTSTSPLAVSDGSVLLSQGNFGWVLATTQPPTSSFIAADQHSALPWILAGQKQMVYFLLPLFSTS
jgi:hypothetical protein